MNAAQEIGPQERRPQQDADADAGDVGAGGMHPDAVGDAAERQLRDDGGGDGQRRALRALEDAEREMRRQQDRRDEQRRQVAVVEPEPCSSAHELLDPVHAVHSGLDRACPADPRASVITARSTCGGRAEAEVQAPLVLRAEPAGRHQILALRLPGPVQLDSRADGAAVARRALQLEADPVARRVARVLRYSSSGPRWLATTTSSTPRLPKSARATARPSKASFAPTACATSVKRAQAVVQPHALALIARQAAALHRRPVRASPMIVLWPTAITEKSYQ